MRTILSTLALILFVSFASFAQSAEERSRNLSDKMIKDLQLNNYQARKIREINLKNAQKMIDFENKFANNPAELEKCINGVCKERDVELEDVLSTAQYSQYYGFRKAFNTYDREYALKLKRKNSKVAKALIAQDKSDEKRSFPAPEATVITPATVNK